MQITDIRRTRAVYYLLTGLFWFSTALLAPLYVLYFQERGLNLGQVGLWAGVNTLAVILMELPTGGLADTWGRSRTFGTANLIIALSLLLMVSFPGTMVLYIGAAVFGTGRALSSGSLDAWFVDELKRTRPDVDVEKELGPAGGVTLLAVAAGSLLGSFLPSLVTGGILPGLPPLALPLIADAVLKIILAVLAVLLVREPVRHKSAVVALKISIGQVPAVFSAAKSLLLKDRRLLLLISAGVAVSLYAGTIETFWQPRLLEAGLRTAFFGVLLSICFVAGAVSSFIVPLITRLMGGRRHITAILYSFASGAAILLLSFTGGVRDTALSMVFCYFLIEGVGLPRKAMINDRVPGEFRATMLSVDSLVSYLGFAGVAALGFLAEARGIPAVWRLTAFMFFPSALLYMLLGRGK